MREEGEGERTRWGQKFDYQVIRRKFGNYLQNGIDSIGGRGGEGVPHHPPSRSPEQEIELGLGLRGGSTVDGQRGKYRN
jgi:hypothetical protein